MTDLSIASRPRRVRGTTLKRGRRRTVILGPQQEALLTVNATAAALFELCDGATSIEEIVGAICDLSSVPAERALDDVLRSLAQFARAGVIEVD
jgi:hypothetical protein